MIEDSFHRNEWSWPGLPSRINFCCMDSTGERHIHITYRGNGGTVFRVVPQSQILYLDDPTRSFLMNRIVTIEEGIFDMVETCQDTSCYPKEITASFYGRE